MEKYYERVLLEMRTNFQFPTDLMFRPQSEQPPKPGLHAKHVENAMQRHFLQKNIFVDCGPSLKRPVTSSGGIPCCMPKHPVYFVDQNRYLNGEDFMNAQGLWPCAFKPEVYREILKTKDLAQDLAGNSFSATVSQAVAVAALVSSSGAWRALSGGGQAGNESSLRRLRGKRKAPEYDKLKGKENGKVSAPRRGGQKRLYKRKVPGVDSRKNNRGKMVRFEQAVSDGDDKPAKAVEEMKGYYRSCVYKWRKTRRQDSWTIICAASPRLAKKFRELPDCIRSFLGKSRKFPNRASAVDESSTCILPVPFQDLVAAMIVERIDVGEEVDFHYVSSLLEAAIEQWNECVGILKKELESPEAILKEIDAGEATSERDWEAGIEKIRAQTQMLRTISLSKSDGAPGEFWKAAERLCRKTSIRMASNLKPGRHLQYSHPGMVAVRDWVNYQVETHKAHGSLLANFDQVWSLNWRPRKKVLQKKPDRDEIAKSMSLRRTRHCIERFMGREPTEKLGERHEVAPWVPAVQGGTTASVAIESWRQPHTLTTLSWVTGELGRGFVTCKDDYLSEKTRSELNKELESWLYIARPRSRSHFWTSETMVEYLEFFAQELRQRRKALGLKHSDRCLLICDHASQHSCKHFAAFKAVWCEQHNVDILTGDSIECSIPGGWGATGSPCDGFHQYLHILTKAFASTTTSWLADFDLRTTQDQLHQSIQSSHTVRCLGSGWSLCGHFLILCQRSLPQQKN
ncbi:unnamed protein product [Cladocopium goreaui]|uniref:Malate dehydrogenase 2, mitochondrial n=1 Tax=Cladocopium goreaui TaxID=2562237 RepID=A0A9P1GNL2_9DINO|nr:unnamed protein product [Cladocopium goreaui]